MTSTKYSFVAPNDPILIHEAQPIPRERITSPEIKQFIEDMRTVAYGEQKDRLKLVLVGLAAPQIGISKRIICVDIGADGKGKVSDLHVYINPEIIEVSTEEEEWYEACFSTSHVCGVVARPKKITLKAYTEEGNLITETYSGYVARIFQHEIDHLNGKVFIDHITNDANLHWVEKEDLPQYRDKESWRTWPNKCTREQWEKIKGII